jgi:hypothetical protein
MTEAKKTLVHLQKTPSTVACGAPMGHWKTQPDGWDLSTATTEASKVTCDKCVATFSRSVR